MSRLTHRIGSVSISASLLAAAPAAAAADACDLVECCVHPDACLITDEQTLAGLTVDAIISCSFRLGTYAGGGNGLTGIAPAVSGACGLSYALTDETPEEALNSLDHHWLQATGDMPLVADLGSPVNTVFVFPSVDHTPFPEEGIESTIWGSDSSDISGFPAGWTQATLTTIWKRGWEDPATCQGQDNADDFTGQYTFAGSGFRYIAAYANGSISIFQDPSHTTWTGANDDYGTPGWQTFDNEIDAIGTPECATGVVVADAGPDQSGAVGQQVCFDGSGSTAMSGIATIGWDTDGNSTIDVNGPTACITCRAAGQSGDVRLFVTDLCGCTDSDTVHYTCNTPPDCSNAAASIGELWPPNHKMVPVSIVGVTDPNGDPVTITINGIRQDEPTNGLGDGDTCPDGAGVGTSTANVRAERSGTPKQPGNGRVYHVSFAADDGQGGRCTGEVTVCVPHDQRPGHVCVDEGPLYDSTACN